jgi:hypothetical protein
VVREAIVGKRLFHDYRRSTVRNMENAGVPRSSAMKVTGHKTESIYQRYAIRNPRDMQEATGLIEERKAKASRTMTH